MRAQQLQLPLTTHAARAPSPGMFRQCTTAAREVAVAMCQRQDGVTIDELRAECIALGIKPSPNNWWGTVLRGEQFVRTTEPRGLGYIWRLA